MAARRKTARKKKTAKKKARRGAALEMIISKSRTKNAVAQCKVSSEFYGALDEKVRELIAAAEVRATANKRSTVRPQDL